MIGCDCHVHRAPHTRVILFFFVIKKLLRDSTSPSQSPLGRLGVNVLLLQLEDPGSNPNETFWFIFLFLKLFKSKIFFNVLIHSFGGFLWREIKASMNHSQNYKQAVPYSYLNITMHSSPFTWCISPHDQNWGFHLYMEVMQIVWPINHESYDHCIVEVRESGQHGKLPTYLTSNQFLFFLVQLKFGKFGFCEKLRSCSVYVGGPHFH